MAGAVIRIADPAFGGTGQSTTAKVYGAFNIAIWGTFVGTVALERALDGTTFVAVATDGTGTAANYTGPVSVTGLEVESEVTYRFNCTAFSSGTIHCRLSQIATDYHPSRAYSRLS
jgi:hypothetical protein